MGVLEDITKMRNRGMTDNDIVKNLQDQGISPKAINDALNQADIKKAVVEQSQENREDDFVPPQDYHGGYGKTQEVSEEDMGEYYPQPPQQEYPDYGMGQQPAYDYPGQSAGLDTSTIIEISEQVFFEKIQKIQKVVDDFSEFKALSESKMDSISDRLKKIESVIDRLQATILEKIGGYGENLDGIRKEMSMMQDSFGKIANSVRNENSGAQKKATAKGGPKKGGGNSDVFSSLKKISKKR